MTHLLAHSDANRPLRLARFGEATAVDHARLEIPAAGLLIVETGR